MPGPPVDPPSWRVLARLGRPLAAGLIAFGGWLAFVVARLTGWADGKLSLFIASGTRYSHPALMFPRIAHVKGKGYDGQFYYRFAFDPFDWHPTAHGITIDHAYRYTRIGYSVAAWLLSSGGHGTLLPVVLVLVNLALMAVARRRVRAAGRAARAVGAAVRRLLRPGDQRGAGHRGAACRRACWADGWPHRRGRFVLAAALISYAVCTNEPVPGPARQRSRSPGWYQVYRRQRPAGAPRTYLGAARVAPAPAAPGHPALGGRAGTAAGRRGRVGEPDLAAHRAGRGPLPDVHRMSWTHLGTYDYNLIEFIVLAAFVAAGPAASLRSTTAPGARAGGLPRLRRRGDRERRPGGSGDSVFGDGRIFVDAYVMAVLLLLATPGRSTRPPASAWACCSPRWRSPLVAGGPPPHPLRNRAALGRRLPLLRALGRWIWHR